MTTSEYLLNVVLVGLVVLQIRGIKLTAAALLVPVVMTAWAASQILQTVPTAGKTWCSSWGSLPAAAG